MMRVYDWATSNEIYKVRLGDSKLFREYSGCSFIDAAVGALEKHACLLGVKRQSGTDGREGVTGSNTADKNAPSALHLNPGKDYVLACACGTCWSITCRTDGRRHMLLHFADLGGPHGVGESGQRR